MIMRSRSIGAIGAVMAGLVGFGAWTFVNGDVAPKASLEALAAATNATTTSNSPDVVVPPTTQLVRVDTAPSSQRPESTSASPSPLDGTWTLEQGEGVFAGYRIDELAAGSTLKSTATGRSAAVAGQLDVVGSVVTGATITVDMTKLSSDMASRDGFMRIAGLRTAEFPEATFALATAFDLGSVPDGADLSVSVPGVLTLKGVGAPVVIAIEARFDGGALLVVGEAPIVLSDFDIDPPTNPFVSVESHGIMEFQLRFVRS
jgi:polyisoprenoid-binding protein YceI